MWCFVKCPGDPEDSFGLYYDWGCRVNIALKVKVLVIQLCLTFCDPLDCSPPGSSVYGILQARVLEWAVIHFSRGSSQSREDQTWVSHIAGRFFTIWATREALNIALGEIKCAWLSIWHEYELFLILFPFKTIFIHSFTYFFLATWDINRGIWDLFFLLLWVTVFSLVSPQGLNCPKASGILVPWLGIEPESPALKCRFSITRPDPFSW